MIAGRHRIRTLVVDDQLLFREALVALLTTDPRIEVVGQANDGHLGAALARQLRPDVVLMDVTLPSLNGIEATRLIREQNRDVVVLLLSGTTAGAVRAEADRAGAAGLIDKGQGMADLIATIVDAASSGRSAGTQVT